VAGAIGGFDATTVSVACLRPGTAPSLESPR